jgi:hypothetical protein
MPRVLAAAEKFDVERISGMSELTPVDKASVLASLGNRADQPSKKRKME